MEYIPLVLFGWLIVCLPAIIITVVANNRRRDEITNLKNSLAGVTKQLERLEHRVQAQTAQAVPPVQAAAPIEAITPAIKISPQETRPAAAPVTPTVPVREKVVPAAVVPEKPQAPVPPPIPQEPVIAPAMAAQRQSQGESKPATLPASQAPIPQPTPPFADEARVVPPPPPRIEPTPERPPVAARTNEASPWLNVSQEPEHASARVRATSMLSDFSSDARIALTPQLPKLPHKKSSISLEELVGTNLLPKLGITIVVFGVGFLVAAKWGSFAPWLRVLLLYVSGLAMLAGGIFTERKERYQTLGRSLIGGGWAITALVTYGLQHAPFMAILSSNALDLLLLLIVISVMVWHTLKYDSQLVTGASFLLAFSSITLNPDPPYNLIAGLLLVTGMTVIVLRRHWFELEIFGILASYLNHFYWLYNIFELEAKRSVFSFHTASMLLVIAYWVVFRCSYVWRKVSSREQESASTIAGLLNPLLFLGVMKYQSFHPEWAFYGLLALGAVEFVLGQLPVSRRRRAPFLVLSSLGAALMVAAVPFKYSGDSLEILWLVGGEAFLLAGIFTRERLFRGFGLIISALIVLYTLPMRIGPLAQELMNGQAHYHPQLGIILGAIAAVLYFNSHIIGERWKELFAEEQERQGLVVLSFAASFFAVCSVCALVNDSALAVVLALMVAALSLLGKQFSIHALVYQAHWIATVTVLKAIDSAKALQPNLYPLSSTIGIPELVLAFVPVAALLYLSARHVRQSETSYKTLFASAYSWAATGLLALLVWYQAPQPWIGVGWIALAVLLALAARLWKDRALLWQTHILSLLAAGWTLYESFAPQYRGTRIQLISVALTVGGLYLLSWIVKIWAGKIEGLVSDARIAQTYTWAATGLLATLIWYQALQLWIAVCWIGVAVLLALAARFWKDGALLWQTHILSLLAAGWTLYESFAPQYRGTRVQLISVALTVGSLYLLNWIVNVAGIAAKETWSNERISQAYSWVGSLLLSWLIWYQFPAIDVALAWGLLGLALFMLGDWKQWGFLRAQSYVALTCSFAHIFYANFNVLGEPGAARPEVLTVIPLVGIYFFIYWQIHGKQSQGSGLESKIRVEYLLACLGTATLAALARFELPPETVAVGYAALVVATLLTVWLTRLQVFLYQGLVLLVMTAFRISMYNFYHLNEAFGSNLSSAVLTIAILAAGIPICFAIRKNAKQTSDRTQWLAMLVGHPEQPMFFVPFVLLAVLLALKVTPGMITLAWGAQAVVVFVLALVAKETSYRRSGLVLLLLSAAKIVLWDVWKMNDVTSRYLTLIGVGLLILVVSYLFSRNREALREYL